MNISYEDGVFTLEDGRTVKLPEGLEINDMNNPYNTSGVDMEGFLFACVWHNNLPVPGNHQWDEHPDFIRYDWREDVTTGDTALGYWAWVRHQIAAAKEET